MGKLEDEETVASLRGNGWTLDDALNEFTAKTHQPILGRSKTPLVWQEMVCPFLALDWF
jgi:hexosaminidase